MENYIHPEDNTYEVQPEGCINSLHDKTHPDPPEVCPKCFNLIQNPSFESGLSEWVSDNVKATDNNPFEGTQAAMMGPGVASMFQDVSLPFQCKSPLFLSFNVEESSVSSGNLIVGVLWLNKYRNVIAEGLRLFIPPSIRTPIQTTFFGITDQPPAGTAGARLLFSKGAGTPPPDALIRIDEVILARTDAINLIQNPGFELGLTGWATSTFEADFRESFIGLAEAAGNENGDTIFQDVPLSLTPPNSPFLLSFAARSLQTSRGSLRAQVQWLDGDSNPVGTPGLDLFIPPGTLNQTVNYLTYLALTNQAPSEAVTARVIFTIVEPSAYIDQIIFTNVPTPNLVQNPSFEDGLTGWTSVNIASVESATAYEGTRVARATEIGGALFQDIPIYNGIGNCYLLNCALNIGSILDKVLITVTWLDENDREIGQGLNLVVPQQFAEKEPIHIWFVYTGVTEPSPPSTAKARIQFTVSSGRPGTFVDIDYVVLGRLI